MSDDSTDTTPDYIAGIGYPQPFADFAVTLCESAARHVAILSPQLDSAVFDREPLAMAIAALVRRSPQARVRILISDARDLAARGHRLLELARRLSSTVHIRALPEHPDWNGQTLVIRDRNGTLYKPAGGGHDAFIEPASRAMAQRQLERFDELWRHAVDDPNLQTLQL